MVSVHYLFIFVSMCLLPIILLLSHLSCAASTGCLLLLAPPEIIDFLKFKFLSKPSISPVNNYLKKSWSMCSMQWHSFFCRFFTSIFGFCQRYVFKIMWFSKIMRNIWYLVDWFLSCNWPVTGPVEWYFVNRFLWCNIPIERGEDGRFGGILANCATDKMFNVSLCPPPVIKPSGRH